MIPVKLNLSNFTSYGANPPELDFTSFKLAAISGQNGAGKSSLLDSITWCLWGTSRAGDSSDALVRLGQTEMFVELSFELDDHLYTVKRRRSKKGGGSTALELWSGSASSPLHNLTEGTIKATQQKIIDVLHLSYETFANSSYIRQGHAEEFTTKGPTDRKRILADILGLDHYDKLEEKAKDKAKEDETKLQLMEYRLIEIEAELSQKEEKEKAYSQLQLEVQKKKQEAKEIEDLIKTIEAEKQTIQVSIKTLLEQKQRFVDLQKEITDLKAQIELKEQAQKEYQLILDKKDLIEKSYEQLQGLKEQSKLLEQKRSELIRVKDELVEIQKALNVREDKRKSAIAQLEVEQKEYQTKVEQLEVQNQHLKKNKTVCPTCGQPIGEETNKQIIAQNQKQIENHSAKLTEVKNKIEKYQSIKLPEEKQVAQKDQQVKSLEEETKDYLEISRQVNELAKFEQGYIKLQQAEIAVKTHQDTSADLQKAYQSRIKDLEKIQNFEADLEAYQVKLYEVENRLNAQVTVKNDLSQQILELTGQVGQAKQLRDRSEQLESLLKDKQTEKNKLTQEKQIYEELALAFGKKGIQAMIIEQAIPEIEDEANRLLDRLTDGRMKVRLETQKETKTKVIGAEGKKDYATVETLDIIISDEMGERAYEMYSGGEAFRVNFAIRLAISKLLTLRAGAKLQFLVVDEGFGNQDAAGRARLVQVIDEIKDDYKKILVITHLDELKEEFPTRIEVSKNATGSSFEIVGV